MVKRKFKDIEKDDGKKESSPPRRSKSQKKEEHEDSGRTVTLTNKNRMASRYNKASVDRIGSIKNVSKEEEERILWCNSDSEESDLMYIKQKISNDVEIISPCRTGKSKNFELNWEKNLDKAHDVTIISESACSSDLSFHQDFSTSLLDLYNFKRVRGDGNWLFRALCLAAFGDDSVHLFLGIMSKITSYSIKKICTIYGWGNDYRSVYCTNDDGGWVGWSLGYSCFLRNL